MLWCIFNNSCFLLHFKDLNCASCGYRRVPSLKVVYNPPYVFFEDQHLAVHLGLQLDLEFHCLPSGPSTSSADGEQDLAGNISLEGFSHGQLTLATTSSLWLCLGA